MEFLDEYESRPRFIQSKNLPPPSDLDDQSLHKFPSLSSLFISLSFSLLLLFLTFFYFNDIEPLKSLLLWLSLSFFLGPFAPPSLTAGDITVGRGDPLSQTLKNQIPKNNNETHDNNKFTRKHVNNNNNNKPPPPLPEVAVQLDGFEEKLAPPKLKENGRVNEKKVFDVGESEWSDGDWDSLRKFVAKHPVGMPGRWEAIADGFKGRHGVEVVIAKSKELSQRKVTNQDSYNKFLKDRKSVDQRVIDETTSANGGGVESGGWSAGEDLALLNALKTFPKEVAMRWEKIAAAVPGKTKAGCQKRVAELKKDFRSSKTT